MPLPEVKQRKYIYLPYKLPHDARLTLFTPSGMVGRSDPYVWNEILHRLHADGDSLVDQAERNGLSPHQFRGLAGGRAGRRVIWTDLDQDWGRRVAGTTGYYIGRIVPGQSNRELAMIRPKDRLIVLGHCGFQSIAMGFKTGFRYEQQPGGGGYGEAWDAYILGPSEICDMLVAGGLSTDVTQVELRGCFTGMASGTGSTDFRPSRKSPLAREVARELGRRGYDQVYVAGYMHETSRSGDYTSGFVAGPGETGQPAYNLKYSSRQRNWGAKSRKIWFDRRGRPYTLTNRMFGSVWGFEGSRTLNALEDVPNAFYTVEDVPPDPRRRPMPMSAVALATAGPRRSVSADEISMSHVVELPPPED